MSCEILAIRINIFRDTFNTIKVGCNLESGSGMAKICLKLCYIHRIC